MKTYIKPNTEVTTVMFEGNLMAGTTFQKLGGNTSSDDFELLGKEDNTPVTNNSVWDEEE